jgi:UPF0755 protein
VSSNSPPGSDDTNAPSALGGRPSRPGPSQVPPPPSDKPTILRSPRAALEPETVPALKRRSKRVRHPLVIAGNAVFTFLVIVFLAVGAALYIGKQRFEAPGPLTEDKSVNISRGLGIRDIAALLEREGVIDQPYVFIGGVTVMKARGGLKHGEYRFTKHASMSDVIETMIEGKVVQHALTIPEGLTSEQIVAKLLQNTALTGQIKEIPREGSLLPETYKFTRGATRAQIIKRMQQAEQREVKEIWAHRMSDLPISTPEELVTLASIVEKETGKQGERSRVAAVFINRLKSKMKLQSDPTIIYGLTGGKGSLGRPILKSEIEQPTPYNTYVINGLPPGPIANPGKASLEAVASPARTKDLFFVADGAGGHVFSETYEQHQKNVAKLRARERAQSKPAVESAPEKAPEKTPETAPEKKNGDKP